jgi:hypothetical protein
MSIFSKTATVVVFVSSLAVLATARDAAAQTACNTTLSGTYDNITVTGGAVYAFKRDRAGQRQRDRGRPPDHHRHDPDQR